MPRPFRASPLHRTLVCPPRERPRVSQVCRHCAPRHDSGHDTLCHGGKPCLDGILGPHDCHDHDRVICESSLVLQSLPGLYHGSLRVGTCTVALSSRSPLLSLRPKIMPAVHSLGGQQHQCHDGLETTPERLSRHVKGHVYLGNRKWGREGSSSKRI